MVGSFLGSLCIHTDPRKLLIRDRELIIIRQAPRIIILCPESPASRTRGFAFGQMVVQSRALRERLSREKTIVFFLIIFNCEETSSLHNGCNTSRKTTVMARTAGSPILRQAQGFSAQARRIRPLRTRCHKISRSLDGSISLVLIRRLEVAYNRCI